MSYKININDFEGPLDLLLFFIQRDKLNIYDIPISKITNDFLKHLNEIKDKNIEIGAEFIYMASLLMKIKSKMLLPQDSIDDEEIIDPRQDLVLKLIEYKKFKQISGRISKMGNNYFEKHKTLINESFQSSFNIEDNIAIGNLDLYELIKTFENLIQNVLNNNIHEVFNESFSIKEQIRVIEKKITNKKRLAFKSIFKSNQSKAYLVCTFIALLEMIKKGMIKIEQKKSYDEIYLINNNN